LPGVNYLRLAGIVLVVMLFPLGYLKGCSDEKERFEAYKGQVAAVGKAQEERTAARIALDNLLKEEADEDNRAAHARLQSAIGELRRERARRSIVPAAPAGATSPDRITFDRAALDRAIRDFDSELTRIIESCDGQRIGLDTAKKWAQHESH
jgi:hypothetical protein